MRYLCLLTLILLSGCYYPYGYPYYGYPYYGYPYGGYGYRAYGPGYPPYYYGPDGQPPGYGGPAPSYGTPPANSGYHMVAPDPNNCGTPDEPKPCRR